MRKIFIIVKGMSYEDRTAFLIDALKAHKNVIDIKDIMSGDNYDTLQRILKKDISEQLKFALVDEMFNMLFDENPNCRTVITTVNDARLIKIAELYYDCQASLVIMNDDDLKDCDDMINNIVKSFDITDHNLVYGEDYEKIAADLLAA